MLGPARRERLACDFRIGAASLPAVQPYCLIEFSKDSVKRVPIGPRKP